MRASLRSRAASRGARSAGVARILAAVALIAVVAAGFGPGVTHAAAVPSDLDPGAGLSVPARLVQRAKQTSAKETVRVETVNASAGATTPTSTTAKPQAPATKPAPVRTVPGVSVTATPVAKKPAPATPTMVKPAPTPAKPSDPNAAPAPAKLPGTLAAKKGMSAVTVAARPALTTVAPPAPPSLDDHPTYVYNALGRRDPFQALVGNGEYVDIDAATEVGGLRVVGIVWGAEDKFALIEDARGNSSVLRPGDKVMNGVVQGLRRDAVLINLTVDGQSQSVTIPLTRKGDSNAKP